MRRYGNCSVPGVLAHLKGCKAKALRQRGSNRTLLDSGEQPILLLLGQQTLQSHFTYEGWAGGCLPIQRDSDRGAGQRNAMLLSVHAQGHVHARGQCGLQELVWTETAAAAA